MVKLKIFFITILLLVMFIFACGESDSGESNTNEDGIVTSRIINNDMVHTIADFEAATFFFPELVFFGADDFLAGIFMVILPHKTLSILK